MSSILPCLLSCYDYIMPRQLYRILKRPEFHELRIQSSIPDLYWTEKFIALIDYFQLFGLLWNISNPWPWPYLWLGWSHYLVLGNMDVFSLTENGAILGRTNDITVSKWGYMRGYMMYALYFAIANGVLYSLIIALYILSKKSHQYRSYYHIVSSYLLLIATIIYLPINLAISRLYYCESGVLGVDASVLCMSSEHSMYAALCSILVLPSTIILPIYLYKRIKHAVIFKYEPTDHEKYIQIQELSCILGLQHEYHHDHIILFASYKLSAAYYTPAMLLYKALLLIIFIFCRKNIIAQAALYLVATIWFTCRYVFYQLPYRCYTTNTIHCIASLLLLGNVSFAAMNAFGVKNALLVASIESYILVAMNITAMMFTLAVIGYCITNPLALYPPVKTILNIITNEKLLYHVKTWLHTLLEADRIKRSFLVSPSAVADIASLESSIRCLRRDYTHARAVGSIFQNMISAKLLELHQFHAQRFSTTLRRNDHWDEAYRKGIENESLIKHHKKTILMNPVKRRILLKLLAMRAFYSPTISSSGINEESSRSIDTLLRESKSRDGKRPSEEDDEELIALEKKTIKLLSSIDIAITQFKYVVGSTDMIESILDQMEVLDELYYHWNDVITSYEQHEELGYDIERSGYTSNQIESWYIYRNVLGEKMQALSQLEFYEDVHINSDDHIDNNVQRRSLEMLSEKYEGRYSSKYESESAYEGVMTVDDEEALLSRIHSTKSGFV